MPTANPFFRRDDIERLEEIIDRLRRAAGIVGADISKILDASKRNAEGDLDLIERTLAAAQHELDHVEQPAASNGKPTTWSRATQILGTLDDLSVDRCTTFELRELSDGYLLRIAYHDGVLGAAPTIGRWHYLAPDCDVDEIVEAAWFAYREFGEREAGERFKFLSVPIYAVGRCVGTLAARGDAERVPRFDSKTRYRAKTRNRSRVATLIEPLDA